MKISEASLVISIDIPGIQLNGTAIGSYRLIIILKLLVSESSLVVSLGILRVHLKSTVIGLDRLFILLILVVGIALSYPALLALSLEERGKESVQWGALFC